VCLDREEIGRKYNQNRSIPLNQLPNLPLLLGIEIKYVALGYQKDYIDLCRKDEDKLKKYQKTRIKDSPNFQYLVLCFLQRPQSLTMKIEDMVNKRKLEKPSEEISEYNSAYVIADRCIYKLPAKTN